MDYRGKVVVVTGASSGIGYDAAQAFAERGSTVIAVARREERLQKLIAECHKHSPGSSYLAGDLGERGFAEHVVEHTVGTQGRLDILINNAAMPMHMQIYDISPDDIERVMRVNFFSCVWTTMAVIPHMLRLGGGTIVNVSSVTTKVGAPRETPYVTSKSAMDGFTRGLWIDLAGSNIHVALIVPGPIDTEIWRKGGSPHGYKGPKYPPRIVTGAIFEAIEKRRYEIVVPQWNPSLIIARLLRLVAPSLLRAGMARMEPVPPQVIENARREATMKFKVR